MNRAELAALADVFGQLDQIVKDVFVISDEHERVIRIGTVQGHIGGLADDFKIAALYPNLRDKPLEYLQNRAKRLHDRVAELEAQAVAQ